MRAMAVEPVPLSDKRLVNIVEWSKHPQMRAMSV
jgi:hypothetical protein